MRFGEGLAHLPEYVHDAARRERPRLAHEPLQVETVQVLHHIIEGADRGAPEVVHRDGVGIREARRELRLALEAAERLFPRAVGGQKLIAVGRRSISCSAR